MFCRHSGYINNEVLKRGWGFPGFVVSDWSGLHDTVQGALGGLDVEMNAGDAIHLYKQPLIDAVHDGRVSEAMVEDHARRVLYVMAKVSELGGIFHAPGVRDTEARHAFVREVAEQATFPRRQADAPAHAPDNYGPVRSNMPRERSSDYRWHDAKRP